MLQHVVTDRVHQVRLAETHAAVDEQRVVRTRRRFGDGAARGVRELVRRADDEGVEGVAGIEAGRPGLRRRRRGRFRAPRLRPALSGIGATVGRRRRRRNSTVRFGRFTSAIASAMTPE